MNYFTTFCVASFFLINAPAFADDVSVDNAFRVCALADATGLTSSKCEVSGFNSSIDIRLDMKADEARKLCSMLVGHIHSHNMDFKPDWTINIYSPYSGTNSIAFCKI